MTLYVANWTIKGLTASPLMPGDTVELDPAVAETVGAALTPVGDESAASNSAAQDTPLTGPAPFPIQPAIVSKAARGKRK